MNIDDLYNKLSKENLSAEESEMINKWKVEAEANAKALLELENINDVDLQGYESYDADKAWKSFKDKTDTRDRTTGNVKWLGLALLVLSLLLAYFVYNFLEKKEKEIDYPIHYATALVKKNLDMVDGSTVILDKSSILTEKNTRSVDLMGRAYFDIVSDPSHPFLINTPVGTVKVMGTRFSVTVDSTTMSIYVEEGRVIFMDGGRSIELRAGDKMALLNGNISKVKMLQENYLSWTDGKLVFRDTPLIQALEDIERHYEQKLRIEDASLLQDCKITTAFQDESYKDVLKELKILIGLKYKKDESGIIIVDSDC